MNCYLPWIVIFPALGGEACQVALEGPMPYGTVPLSIYLTAFLVTFVVELTFVTALLRRRQTRIVLAVFTANLVTHPAAVYLWMPLAAGRLEMSGRASLMLAEFVIPVIESIVYLGFGLGRAPRALLIALVSNFASWAAVAILQSYSIF